MTKQKVMIIANTDVTHEAALQKFEEKFEVIFYKLETREKLIKDFTSGILSDISGILSFWMGFTPVGGLNDELVSLLPPSLKVIAAPSVGYDHYNAPALTKRGIVLTNSPGFSTDAVADIALHLALSTYRYTTILERALREQQHTIKARQSVATMDLSTGVAPKEGFSNEFAYGHVVGNKLSMSPKGHIAGIAGFGAIGQATAKRLAAIGMKIHYYRRNKLSPEQEKELGYEVTSHDSMDSLFKVSELLVLTLPLSPETHHMVNEESIKLLPDGAKIVNVGRGALIHEEVLVSALNTGKLSSAGIDVFEKEPLVNPELLRREDVTLLPHLGGAESDAAHSAWAHCLDAIEDVLLKGGNGLTPVN